MRRLRKRLREGGRPGVADDVGFEVERREQRRLGQRHREDGRAVVAEGGATIVLCDFSDGGRRCAFDDAWMEHSRVLSAPEGATPVSRRFETTTQRIASPTSSLASTITDSDGSRSVPLAQRNAAAP